MAPPIFTISTARQRFFALFEAVTGPRGRKVVITSRGSENHAVLVGEAYLNELEAAAKRLLDIESGKAKPAVGFKLIGSLRERRTLWPIFEVMPMRFGKRNWRSLENR